MSLIHQIIEQVKRLSPAERGQVAVEVATLVAEDVRRAIRPTCDLGQASRM